MRREGIVIHISEEARKNYIKKVNKKYSCPNCELKIIKQNGIGSLTHVIMIFGY